MADAGWMNDPSDPALARWFDGDAWTEHTLVKADWLGDGPPPPPVIQDRIPAFAAAVPPSEPTLAQPTLAAPPPSPPPTTPALTRATDRCNGWPRWARIGAPVAAGLVLIGAIGAAGGGDDDDKSKLKTEPAAEVTLDDAVDIADAALDVPVSTRTLRSIVKEMCDEDLDGAAVAAASSSDDLGDIEDVVDASGTGAAAFCPDVADRHPSLVNDVYFAARTLHVASTTVTTLPSTTTVPTTVAPAVTQAPVTTSAPVTTRAPATTKAPTTTKAPASGCDQNYSGCLNPNSADYDCAGGSGNGPDYTGEVQVLGNDHFGLDADHDGVGCESS